MAPADLAPAVGFRFRPTDQELVGHYLRHKLKSDDLSIHDIIPEIGVCKYEPWDLLDWAVSASATKFDESQCFFFSPLDYKYPKSNRSNRTTFRGFWKVTGRDREITSKGTNKVIGIKKTLVYYEGRGAHKIKTNWVIHEYHDEQLCFDQRTHVLIWLRKDNKKKTKEKCHQLVDDGRRTINEMKNQDYYLSDRGSMIEVSSQSNDEAIDSMIQPFESNKSIDSMIQISPMIQVSSQSNEVIDPMVQPVESNNAVDSMIQVSTPSSQDEYSNSQISSQSNDIITPTKQISSQSYEAMDSDEIGFSLFDSFESSEFDFASLLQSPRKEEQGLFRNNGSI